MARFCTWNNAQKTKENDVKMILFSLAYLTPIKFHFVGVQTREIFQKKKNGHKPFYSQANDKEW